MPEKKDYDPAELEIIRFDSQDVITTSNGDQEEPDGREDDYGWT